MEDTVLNPYYVRNPKPAESSSALLQLSIVEYDPETNDLKTVSLHYFEEDELRVRTSLGLY